MSEEKLRQWLKQLSSNANDKTSGRKRPGHHPQLFHQDKETMILVKFFKHWLSDSPSVIKGCTAYLTVLNTQKRYIKVKHLYFYFCYIWGTKVGLNLSFSLLPKHSGPVILPSYISPGLNFLNFSRISLYLSTSEKQVGIISYNQTNLRKKYCFHVTFQFINIFYGS